MCPTKQKIIQKRVQRKERFARMARIRYRKRNNVIAKSNFLTDIEKCHDDSTLVHEFCPGIFIGERDGGIDCETSMLNKNYITNCINIIKDDEVKLVQLKLCKNTVKCDSPSTEELETWKNREDCELSKWAERFKGFQEVYNNFLVKHQDKFTNGNFDAATVNRYKAYLQQRKEVMATKNCVEIKTRFTPKEDFVSEVVYNSNYIGALGYGIDEFVDKILREGIPRIKCAENNNGFQMSHMMENFESLFEKSLQFAHKEEPKLLGKDQNLRSTRQFMLASGYFLKKRAELSYIIIFDDIKPLPDSRALVESLHLPVLRDETSDRQERINFLEKYYRPQIACQCCTIKEADVLSSEEEEEVCTKLEAEDTIMNEEVCNEGHDGHDEHVKSEKSCENGAQSMANSNASNIIIPVPDRARVSVCPPQMFQTPYRKLLQSYMFLFQNNQMNYINN